LINIALIGFMGSGKTTVGRMIAERLNYSFIDTDKLIEEKTGKAISDIFKNEGEDSFRQIESRVLEEVLKGRGAIVSCGGGIVLREKNRAMLKESSVVIYLRAEASELFKRVGGTGYKRPLLNVENPMQEVERLLKERDPLYREVADITIDTTGRRLDEVVDLIINELNAKGIYLD